MSIRTFVVILLCCGPLAAETLTPDNFPYWKDVQGEVDRTSIIALPLDCDIYEHCQLNMNDLRLFDDQSKAIPFMLVKAVGQKQTARTVPIATAKVESLEESEDGRLEIRLQLPEKKPSPRGLRIHTPLRDFDLNVQVLGSEDGQAWHTLAENVHIYDYTRFIDVRQCDVPLPENNCRHFKLIVNRGTEQRQQALVQLSRQLKGGQELSRTETSKLRTRPFRIESVQFIDKKETITAEEARVQNYPVTSFEVGTEGKTTVVLLKMRRQPVTSLVMVTESANFSRDVKVEVQRPRGPTTQWATIATGRLSRVQFRDTDHENLRISFPEQRQEAYRLVIDNGDSPPLSIDGVQARGNVYELLYMSDTVKGHRLCFGAEDMDPPVYDTAAIQELHRKHQPVQANLGPVQQNPSITKPALSAQSLLNNKVFFGTVVAVMVLVLAWILVRTGSQLNTPESE